MNIFFRTNFSNNIGIGHIVRCSRLAEEFERKGYKCFFYLDTLKSYKLTSFPSFGLYQNKNNFSETKDAKLFCESTRNKGKGYVVVDDYRLGYRWEKYVSRFHKKIITFDDLNNKIHFSDYIINYNPINYPEIKFRKKLNKKDNSNFLIHPKYSIVSRKEIKKNFTFKKDNFYITFYVGGGGQLSLFTKILKALANNRKASQNIRYIVVFGKLSRNKKEIINLSKRYKNIKYFDRHNSLYYLIKNSHIFFGTSGTAIFETAYLKTPSILFQMSKNQQTNIFSLENLGHYIFLNRHDLLDKNKIMNLIILIKNNYNRFYQLNKKPTINIDNKGSLRVIKKVLEPKKLKETNKIKVRIKTGLKIRKVNDKDLNHYLYCRNLKLNRRMSSNSKMISTLDHYIWWYKTKRESYVLLENGKRILYFYDEKINFFTKKKYYLSGWFACDDKCNIRHILFALNWQKKLRKNITWVSFVKKTNLLAIKYSKNLDWRILKRKDKIINLIKKKFKLDDKHFIFYERRA